MENTLRHAIHFAFGVVLFIGPVAKLEAADAVVGNGLPASCTEAALDTAVAGLNSGGGTMTFNCGGPATIYITSEKFFDSEGVAFVIDGAGLITLSGQDATRIIQHRGGTLSLRNITLQNGRASGAEDFASGGAIRSDRLFGEIVLNLLNVTFRNNESNLTGTPPLPFHPFDYGGAAVFARSGTLSVTNCLFTNNTANNSSGGAIHGRSSTINVSGTTFLTNASNLGGFGGAMYTDGLSPNGGNGTLRVASSTFTGNTAYNIGGAFYNYLHDATEWVTFDTVVFQGNQVVESSGTTFLGNLAQGGAGVVDGGNLVVLGSTFSGNSARSSTGPGSGGGLGLTNNSSISITNSTFSANQAIGVFPNNTNASGGGLVIYGNATPFQIRNSTITLNTAGWTGGGIQSTTSGVLTNTIVANNTAANQFNIARQCSAQLINGGGVIHFPNIIGAQNAQNPYCASGALVVNPNLQPLATNGGYSSTHALLAGSAAINVGSCVPGVTTDQRGVTRPSGACDIGAFEFTATAAPEIVYRLRHAAIGAYLFTIFPSERDSAQASFGYLYEGICCKWYGATAADGRTPLYRLFSASAGEYFFTIYASERDSAVANFGYIYEGVAAYAHPGAAAPAPTEWHRLRFGNKHFYTAYAAERDAAVAIGYIYEGVSAFLPPPS